MVDAWIELCVHSDAYRTFRSLRVHKLRGSDFLPGAHAIVLSSEGMRVLPRLEAQVRPVDDVSDSDSVVTSGHPDLDAQLSGGLDEASVTLVVGPTGSGKTTLGLRFLTACSSEAPGLCFSFFESPGRLLQKSRILGIDLKPLVDSGALRFRWQLATEGQLDQMANDIICDVEARGVRRVLLDGFNGFAQAAFFKDRLGPYFSALTHSLRLRGCTTLVTYETAQMLRDTGVVQVEAVSAIADNIILLRQFDPGAGRRSCRSLTVIKTRDRGFDPAAMEFTIGQGGIQFATDAPAESG
jgi:circadian clock protein KaiC